MKRKTKKRESQPRKTRKKVAACAAAAGMVLAIEAGCSDSGQPVNPDARRDVPVASDVIEGADRLVGDLKTSDLPVAKKDAPIYAILPPVMPPQKDLGGIKKDGPPIYPIMPPPKKDHMIIAILPPLPKKDGHVYYIMPPLPKKDGHVYYIMPPLPKKDGSSA